MHLFAHEGHSAAHTTGNPIVSVLLVTAAVLVFMIIASWAANRFTALPIKIKEDEEV